MILPRDNAADLEEVPVGVRHDLEVIFTEDMQEVLAAALEPKQADVGPVSHREASVDATLGTPPGHHPERSGGRHARTRRRHPRTRRCAKDHAHVPWHGASS